MRDSGNAIQPPGDRGQLVLVAALALALALVALGIAYLQLGYHDDVRMPDQEPAQQLDAVLERAVQDASADVSDTYHWDDRGDAVRAVRDELNETREQLETSRVNEGHVYHVSFNETHADQWATENCPDGPNRQFGSCESMDGVALQERADRTHVLAVAFDLVITTPDGESSVTIAVERRPP